MKQRRNKKIIIWIEKFAAYGKRHGKPAVSLAAVLALCLVAAAAAGSVPPPAAVRPGQPPLRRLGPGVGEVHTSGYERIRLGAAGLLPRSPRRPLRTH